VGPSFSTISNPKIVRRGEGCGVRTKVSCERSELPPCPHPFIDRNILYRPLKQGTKKIVFAAIPFHGCEHLRAFSAQRPGLLNAVSIRTTLIRVSKRAVKLGPDALRQPKSLKAAERARLQAALLALGGDQAAIENQSRRFCLRRPSGQIEFEFRDGDLRVFYRIKDGQVLVDAIGRKHGNRSAHRRQEGDPVKIENIREVKTRFSRYIKELSETAPSSLPKTADLAPRWCR
jgi:mRNA-degrading endonuclease RelE of RelBE toxin-antitoxin system